MGLKFAIILTKLSQVPNLHGLILGCYGKLVIVERVAFHCAHMTSRLSIIIDYNFKFIHTLLSDNPIFVNTQLIYQTIAIFINSNISKIVITSCLTLESMGQNTDQWILQMLRIV